MRLIHCCTTTLLKPNDIVYVHGLKMYYIDDVNQMYTRLTVTGLHTVIDVINSRRPTVWVQKVSEIVEAHLSSMDAMMCMEEIMIWADYWNHLGNVVFVKSVSCTNQLFFFFLTRHAMNKIEVPDVEP